jgi:hypothetical protein
MYKYVRIVKRLIMAMLKRDDTDAQFRLPTQATEVHVQPVSTVTWNDLPSDVLMHLISFSTLGEMNAVHQVVLKDVYRHSVQKVMFATKMWSGMKELLSALQCIHCPPQVSSSVRHLNNVSMHLLDLIKSDFNQITHLHVVGEGTFDPALLPSKIQVLVISCAEAIDIILPTAFPTTLTWLRIKMTARQFSQPPLRLAGKPIVRLSTLPGALTHLQVEHVRLLCDTYPGDLRDVAYGAHDISTHLESNKAPSSVSCQSFSQI